MSTLLPAPSFHTSNLSVDFAGDPPPDDALFTTPVQFDITPRFGTGQNITVCHHSDETPQILSVTIEFDGSATKKVGNQTWTMSDEQADALTTGETITASFINPSYGTESGSNAEMWSFIVIGSIYVVNPAWNNGAPYPVPMDHALQMSKARVQQMANLH